MFRLVVPRPVSHRTHCQLSMLYTIVVPQPLAIVASASITLPLVVSKVYFAFNVPVK